MKWEPPGCAEGDFKFGFVGQSPKCKMQNRDAGETGMQLAKKMISYMGKRFFGCMFAKFYHQLAFAQTKGLINFAFCILHFAFPIPPTQKSPPP